jgi:hypothetical protein
MVATTFLLSFILLGILAYQQFFIPEASLWPWIPYVLFEFFLFLRARRLKRRVAELVGAAAARCGFTRIKKAV